MVGPVHRALLFCRKAPGMVLWKPVAPISMAVGVCMQRAHQLRDWNTPQLGILLECLEILVSADTRVKLCA